MKKRLASFIWSAVIWRKKNQITKCAINSVTLQKEEFNLALFIGSAATAVLMGAAIGWVAFFLMARTGNTGGEIRHTEIRSSFGTVQNTGLQENKVDED